MATQLLDRRPMTPRQLEVWRFMHQYQTQNGMPPCLRKIGKHIGSTSSNWPHQVVLQLYRKGMVTRCPRGPVYVYVAAVTATPHPDSDPPPAKEKAHGKKASLRAKTR